MSASVETPDSFDWFDEQWQLWLQQAKHDQVPNALLLTGAPGIGKYILACRYARFLLCLQPGEQTACGTCKSCLLFSAGSHLDFMNIHPEEKSRSVKIDQVRRLTDFVHGRPQIGRRIVAILRPAEAMNVYSANAVLKTLEEPPGDATIILLSQQASLLLPTIRSRCQIIKLPLPEVAQASEWLVQQTGRKQEEMAELLVTAAGQPMTALAWIDSEQAESKQQILQQWADYMSGRIDAFSVAAGWAKLDTEWVLTWLGGWLKDILMAQQDSHYPLSEILTGLGKRLSSEAIWCLFQETLNIRKSHNEQRNLNMQLVFEHWLLLNKRKY